MWRLALVLSRRWRWRDVLLADGIAVRDLEEDGIWFATIEVDKFHGADACAGVIHGLADDEMEVGVGPSFDGLNDGLVVADPADGTGDCGSGAFDV